MPSAAAGVFSNAVWLVPQQMCLSETLHISDHHSQPSRCNWVQDEQAVSLTRHERHAQEGTLTPKEAGVGMLTLTGWSAALGVLSLIAVVLGGAILGYWKYKGYDKMTAYTRVSKADRAASSTS